MDGSHACSQDTIGSDWQLPAGFGPKKVTGALGGTDGQRQRRGRPKECRTRKPSWESGRLRAGLGRCVVS